MSAPKLPDDAILFVDVETTGLDFDKDELLEVALILTDGDLNELDSFSTVVRPSWRGRRRLKKNDYVRRMHLDSGLLPLTPYGDKPHVAEHRAWEWLSKRPRERGPRIRTTIGRVRLDLPMGGSSVHFDREMLRRRMPMLHKAAWSHRNIDASSFYEVAKRRGTKVRKHDSLHRAEDDARDSIYLLRRLVREGIYR